MNLASLRQMLRNRRNREEVYSRPEYWNSKTEEYEGDAVSMWPNNNLNKLYQREQIELLDAELPNIKSQNILDLGCGTGRIARYLARRGARVTGVDFADKPIAIARSLSTGNNPCYEVGSMFELQGENLYDVVVSWGSVAVACRNDKQLRTVADSLHKLLRPSGRLLLLEPVHRGFVHRVLNLSQHEFCEVLESAGFQKVGARQLHFWPVRFALAFVPWPSWITTPFYHLGQLVMKLGGGHCGGDYKAIFAVSKKQIPAK